MGEPFLSNAGDEWVWEEWTRESHWALAVSAVRYRHDGEWPWQVSFAAGEFIRKGWFARRLSMKLYRSMLAVDGVRRVAREDNEEWIIAGNPSGPALVTAAARVLDRHEKRILREVLG